MPGFNSKKMRKWLWSMGESRACWGYQRMNLVVYKNAMSNNQTFLGERVCVCVAPRTSTFFIDLAQGRTFVSPVMKTMSSWSKLLAASFFRWELSISYKKSSILSLSRIKNSVSVSTNSFCSANTWLPGVFNSFYFCLSWQISGGIMHHNSTFS